MNDSRRNIALLAMVALMMGGPQVSREQYAAAHKPPELPKPDPELRDKLRSARAARNLRRLEKWNGSR